ncbi:hypothetical protein AM592_14180 [Bacillus gobiensis]|uniref:Uncharacterized protein n=1 Tax=Bacillus gobiensis TaxID=1441095 RepID=A0A0M4GAL0_9BACI|nr:hypothetical protein AM592_14180 [Bacillus gobiensis]
MYDLIFIIYLSFSSMIFSYRFFKIKSIILRIEEDHMNFPNTYINEQEIKNTAIKVQNQLKKR